MIPFSCSDDGFKWVPWRHTHSFSYSLLDSVWMQGSSTCIWATGTALIPVSFAVGSWESVRVDTNLTDHTVIIPTPSIHIPHEFDLTHIYSMALINTMCLCNHRTAHNIAKIKCTQKFVLMITLLNKLCTLYVYQETYTTPYKVSWGWQQLVTPVRWYV